LENSLKIQKIREKLTSALDNVKGPLKKSKGQNLQVDPIEGVLKYFEIGVVVKILFF
jgi:hypothetical protein